MFENLSIQQIISLASVVLAVVYRIVRFNQIKKKNLTKEGREYIAAKGGKIIVLLEMRIFIMVIIFILVSTLKISLESTIIIQLCIWMASIIADKKASR